MSGGIYLLQSGDSLVRMDEHPYESEALLQELLAKYPNLMAGEQTDAEIIDGNSILTYTSLKAIDNVSAILTRSAVYNDYAIDAGRFSLTDWVLTFPTKRFYVNTATPAPFSRVWSSSTSSSCDSISLTYYDREERSFS